MASWLFEYKEAQDKGRSESGRSSAVGTQNGVVEEFTYRISGNPASIFMSFQARLWRVACVWLWHCAWPKFAEVLRDELGETVFVRRFPQFDRCFYTAACTKAAEDNHAIVCLTVWQWSRVTWVGWLNQPEGVCFTDRPLKSVRQAFHLGVL